MPLLSLYLTLFPDPPMYPSSPVHALLPSIPFPASPHPLPFFRPSSSLLPPLPAPNPFHPTPLLSSPPVPIWSIAEPVGRQGAFLPVHHALPRRGRQRLRGDDPELYGTDREHTSQLGSKVLLFQSTMPSLGAGRLRLRGDDPRLCMARTGSSTAHCSEDAFYKTPAAEFSRAQLCVDVFVFSSKNCDLASRAS
ncbi:unnamed protein product [Closterium sp. Yama58-4]|nr:unnamed protein product [Closterium sp. Yama58-4]